MRKHVMKGGNSENEANHRGPSTCVWVWLDTVGLAVSVRTARAGLSAKGPGRLGANTKTMSVFAEDDRSEAALVLFGAKSRAASGARPATVLWCDVTCWASLSHHELVI
jgi:hypothetical protein